MSTATPPDGPPGSRFRRTLVALLPLLVFLGLAGVFGLMLYSGDPSKLPSAMIGKPAPAFELPGIEGLVADGKPVPGFASGDLGKGQVALVNVWASWCTPCHAEHPYLTALAQRAKVPLYGINWKDAPANARQFLADLGNPFTAIGADAAGRTVIDWGVYGAPETFIVDGKGRITYRHVGPITETDIVGKLLPEIERAKTL